MAEDMEGVLQAQQVPQVEVIAEVFARALEQAQGPPTLEWCLDQAPGKVCKFDEPSAGSHQDTSVCLPCYTRHEKCLISLDWQAAWIAMEQEWEEEWVWGQLGKVQKARVLEKESTEQLAGKVGPPQSGQRERVLVAVDKGKRRASLLPEVGPNKRPWGHELMVEPPGPHIYSPTLGAPLEQASSSPEPTPSITEVFLRQQVEALMVALMAWEGKLKRAGEDCDVAQREQDMLQWKWDTAMQVAMEHTLEVWGV
ncbi:hypothetical protein C0989_002891 [Termitomyces sp. Mn162]|nr:hypothetical protein C0989_002891 [Termitomyces sp. Mn162]